MPEQRPHAAPLIDTEQVYADSDAGLDHMGRMPATSLAHAFQMDWPWILGAIVIVGWDIMALAGYFRW